MVRSKEPTVRLCPGLPSPAWHAGSQAFVNPHVTGGSWTPVVVNGERRVLCRSCVEDMRRSMKRSRSLTWWTVEEDVDA